jgi:oxygen-independent coproporphyrinogen-3 oxidase
MSNDGHSPVAPAARAEPLACPSLGLDLPEWGSYFVAAYPPFSQWSPEALDDCRRVLEQPVLGALDGPAGSEPSRLGLYVHVPFCVDRCRYCYYLSYDRGDACFDLECYVDALVAEAATYAARPAIGGRPLDFVYVGGGTPSLLSRPALERLFSGLQASLPWSAAREVTFECAPRSVTPAKMELLRAAGVTRLSLGVQQLDDEVLARNGRVHLVRHVEGAYDAIRRAGFDVVNLDLMVGLVGQTRDSLLSGVERVIEMAPESVTLYQLEIPRNTPLHRDLESGRESGEALADWEEKHRRVALAFDVLAAAGYQPISAYAMVKDPARHAFLYQREQYHGADLLGIGASAFGYVQGVHHQNATSLRGYVERAAGGELPLYRAYRLAAEERLIRELVLQLKLGGLRRCDFTRRFGVDVLARFREQIEPLVEVGWLAVDDEEIRLTRLGIPRVDRLIPAFYREPHRDVRYS